MKNIILRLVLLFGAGWVATPTLGAAHIDFDCKSGEPLYACVHRGGAKAVYIYDHIDSLTAARIAELDGILQAAAPFPVVYLNSRGGQSAAAMQIGRVLRRRKARVEALDYFRPHTLSGCWSACVMVAAGATERNLIHIGLHSGASVSVNERGKTVPAPRDENYERIERQYYEEMDINPEVLQIEQKTPNSDFAEYHLSLDEPFEIQKIVQLGFRMRKPDEEETKRLSRISADSTEDERALEIAVERYKDKEAAFLLGRRYLFGQRGVVANGASAEKWFKKAMELGSDDAIAQLASAYRYGLGVQPPCYVPVIWRFSKIVSGAGGRMRRA